MSFNNSIKFILNNIFKPVVDTIFPPVCFLCASLMESDRKVVCTSCWLQLKLLSVNELNDIKNTISKNNFNDIYILYDFTEVFQKIIHLLKYEQCIYLAYYFAQELILKYKKSFFINYDYILPVPLHKIKFRERGYNQCYEIIQYLPGNKNKNILKRIKNTQSQTKLTRKERILNVSNAFVCNGNILSKKILLVDDIITTGSTLSECGKVLLNDGASQVDILCLAAPLKHI